jgi:hypothetical protein
MFGKLSLTAEQIATRASRREFLGRVGRGATALSAVVGGLLALSDDACAAASGCPPGTFQSCVATAKQAAGENSR